MNLIILDRDGVINFESDDFIKSPAEWNPIPGSLEAISQLNAAGWNVVIATNQSGLARGLFNLVDLKAIHDKMKYMLKLHNAKVDLIVWCPHADSDQCNCRKPKPGLYQKIAKEFNCSLKDVPVVGDSKRDLDAAILVGARPILVKTGNGQKTLLTEKLSYNLEVYDNLREFVSKLLIA